MSHLIPCTAQAAKHSLEANKPLPPGKKSPWFLLQLSTSPFKNLVCQWMGIPAKLRFALLVSRMSAEHLEKNTPPFCLPYFKNTKGNKDFFPPPSPFTEFSAICIKLPQAIAVDAFLHKRHWCGAKRGSLTKRWFFLSEQHTHSAWAAVPKERDESMFFT